VARMFSFDAADIVPLCESLASRRRLSQSIRDALVLQHSLASGSTDELFRQYPFLRAKLDQGSQPVRVALPRVSDQDLLGSVDITQDRSGQSGQNLINSLLRFQSGV